MLFSENICNVVVNILRIQGMNDVIVANEAMSALICLCGIHFFFDQTNEHDYLIISADNFMFICVQQFLDLGISLPIVQILHKFGGSTPVTAKIGCAAIAGLLKSNIEERTNKIVKAGVVGSLLDLLKSIGISNVDVSLQGLVALENIPIEKLIDGGAVGVIYSILKSLGSVSPEISQICFIVVLKILQNIHVHGDVNFQIHSRISDMFCDIGMCELSVYIVRTHFRHVLIPFYRFWCFLAGFWVELYDTQLCLKTSTNGISENGKKLLNAGIDLLLLEINNPSVLASMEDIGYKENEIMLKSVKIWNWGTKQRFFLENPDAKSNFEMWSRNKFSDSED
jgi:hypothetical protein